MLGDLSMMLCDPYAVHFLATSSLKILNNLVATEGLPREHHILILLLRMLALGLSAWQMIDSQVFPCHGAQDLVSGRILVQFTFPHPLFRNSESRGWIPKW